MSQTSQNSHEQLISPTGVGKDTMLRLAHERQIPYYRVGDRFRFLPSELLRQTMGGKRPKHSLVREQ